MSERLEYSSIPVRRLHPPVIGLMEALNTAGCYIAGGYARWACSPRDHTPLPNDIDVICPSEDCFAKAKVMLGQGGARQVRDSEFSCSLSGYDVGREIQLLKTYTGDSVSECMELIDFSVCRVALMTPHEALAHKTYIKDERKGRLQVLHINTEAIVNTTCRMLRYAQKGYDISQADVLKVLKSVAGSSVANAEEDLKCTPEAYYRDVIS